MNTRNGQKGTHQPVLIIPHRSPALEAIAREVIAGAAEAGYTSPEPILLTGSEENLVSVGSAPLVFLGWRADSPESRRQARKTLAAVARLAPTTRYVAKFEASISGGASAAAPDDANAEGEHLRTLGPVEPFAIAHAADGESPAPHELARARRWGAEMYSQWLTVQTKSGAAARPSETSTPHALSWCGAME
jgi:hypothetical protein